MIDKEQFERRGYYEDEPLVVKSPRVMAESLGFIEDEERLNETEQFFTLDTESPLGKGQITLKFTDSPDEGPDKTQMIAMGVRLANGDLSDEDVLPLHEMFASLVTSGESNGLPVDALKNDGYKKLYRVLREELAQDEFGNHVITGLHENLDRLHKDKAALETKEEATIDSVVNRFRQRFPEFTHSQTIEKSQDTYLYAEGVGTDPIQAVLITDKGRGFDAKIGTITVEQGKKKVTIKGKGGMVYLSPISKDANDEDFRSWSYADTDEAVTYAQAVRDGLTVDQAFLQQPATWSEELNRALTYQEVIAYQMDRTAISEKRLKLPDTSVVPAKRSYALSSDALQKLTRARLDSANDEEIKIHTGEVIPKEQALREIAGQSELGKRIMRSQVITLESQISLLQTDRYQIGD